MSRGWTAFVAGPIDDFGLGFTLLFLIAVALVIGAGWQWFPAWIPRSNPFRGLFRRRSWRGGFWRRLWNGSVRGGWRRKRRRVKTSTTDTVGVDGDDELPDLPAAAFLSNADRLAAEGRYAEAVRERLRAIVRTLVDTGVIVGLPGWTVSELARAAGAVRRPLEQPLDDAARVFSDIWYGERPAYASHDAQMRTYARQIEAVLEPTPSGAAR
jgi:hypothetical protein